MKKSETLLEHHEKINNRMYDVLAKRFFMIAKDSSNSKDDIEFLTKISGSLGHLSHVSIGITKTFKHEKQLQSLEDKLKNIPINMSMFEEAPLEKYR